MLTTILLTFAFVAAVVLMDTIFAWALCRSAARGDAVMYAAFESGGTRSVVSPSKPEGAIAGPDGAGPSTINDLADQHALLCRAEDRFAGVSFAAGLIVGTVLTTIAFVFCSHL